MNRTLHPVSGEIHLRVVIPDQTLELRNETRILRSWEVSTARNGPGEISGSGCTPRGWHRIRACIGEGLPPGTIFRGRRPTGEIYDEAMERCYPGRDWILTRILWLGGLEPGRNRYGRVDTTWRYIYIHGSPDHGVNGTPASHGCIRLRSPDMIDLFDSVCPGMRVRIEA